MAIDVYITTMYVMVILIVGMAVMNGPVVSNTICLKIYFTHIRMILQLFNSTMNAVVFCFTSKNSFSFIKNCFVFGFAGGDIDGEFFQDA